MASRTISSSTLGKESFNQMRKWLIILMTLLAMSVQAQRQQISYIEETKNWYYIYDEAGKKIGGLSRSSVGELKG